jgi:hypothetical protein
MQTQQQQQQPQQSAFPCLRNFERREQLAGYDKTINFLSSLPGTLGVSRRPIYRPLPYAVVSPVVKIFLSARRFKETYCTSKNANVISNFCGWENIVTPIVDTVSRQCWCRLN